MTKNSSSAGSSNEMSSSKKGGRQTRRDRPVFDSCNIGQRVGAEAYDDHSYGGEAVANFYTKRPSRIASVSEFDRAFNAIH